ncbi:ABC transporter substrate-binding protein [Pseudorhodoferax sp. Leaf267]|uniref:ABC transporter substrate-binding protein n=1 Tax=Pseudorhodoferax sp. Leaf267 TaxID=1736316 RepID=UPI0006FADD67|nr:ABC transporter substrate-binding protein [Pseudorhodoferax sp. Leaf267]KQP17662.1 hypothetical protein ASF43_07175 [Pseudorhodoferax sp. Leaf267]
MRGHCTRRRACAALVVAGLGLAGCGRTAPIRIGFLAELTGRTARFGEDGRNGVMLAVEQRNLAGGVAGRQLELVVQDHGAQLAQALQALQALQGAGVQAVIGPFSSDVAVQLLPQADAARLLLLSPVVTAVSLAGKDDHLVRLNRSTRENARDLAQLLHQRGQRRLSLATDLRNRAYHVAWRDDFHAAFTALGGVVAADAEFGQGGAVSYDEVMRAMLAGRPDGLVAICASVDAALIAQQAFKHRAVLPMATLTASDALLELGGEAIEGIVVVQSHDRASTAPAYLAFHQAYEARFGREPSYSAVASYDAVTVLAQALAQAGRDEPLRDAVLRLQPYPGLQQPIRFDRFGDSSRAAHFSTVRNGRFEPL